MGTTNEMCSGALISILRHSLGFIHASDAGLPLLILYTQFLLRNGKEQEIGL